MHFIFLKDYNNYFNRILKVNKSLNDYLTNREYYSTPKINVHIADGLVIQHVVNWDLAWCPDYALLISDDNKILSKWFVIGWIKTRFKQYTATLKNDVLANYRQAILGSPIFVRKGMLQANSPLIFNKENVSVNQIKVKEHLLKDKTGISWLVGYVAQNSQPDKPIETVFSHIEGSEPVVDISTIDSKVNINFNNDKALTYGTPTFDLNVYARPQYQKYKNEYNNHFKIVDDKCEFIGLSNHYYSPASQEVENKPFLYVYNDDMAKQFITAMHNNMVIAESFMKGVANFYFTNEISHSVSDEYIKSLNNITIKKDSEIYVLKVTEVLEFTPKEIYLDQEDDDVVFNNLTTGDLKQYAVDPRPNIFANLTFNSRRFVVSAVISNESRESLEITIPQTRNHTNDAPYDMFCIPFDRDNKLVQSFTTDTGTIMINNLYSLAMAKGIATASGGVGTSGTFVYDVQLLPYCPIKEIRDIVSNNNYDIRTTLGFVNDQDYSIIYKKKDTSTKTPVSIVFWGTRTSGTFDIEYNYEIPNDPLEKKLMSETTFVRLCSPNYNTGFDFNAVKNNGIRKFNVDFTYKPFNPYIHINPDFSGLYGKDYNDARGLVIGGDFSIATLTDAWARYELNNKNYQQIFDRQIEHMDYENNLNLITQGIELGLGTLTAGIGGATAGALAGGPTGAVAGAVAGSVGTAVGGTADILVGQASFRENKQYTKDMFTFQLGNIKALPQGIAKTTAFTFNNKVFPFLEEYTCSDIEKKALKDKIIYNGMTVMAIGTIGEYLNKYIDKSWFEGQLIRCEGISEDSHIIYEIAEELNKGVFIDEY